MPIRIVPEWNVKVSICSYQKLDPEIRIIPEWNVKEIWDVIVRYVKRIRIVPEWNVKVAKGGHASDINKLESYQSGMQRIFLFVCNCRYARLESYQSGM